MRSLATLGGVLVLIVLAIAWKISNQVEAGQEPDDSSGRVTLGVTPDDADSDLRSPGSAGTAGTAGNGSDSGASESNLSSPSGGQEDPINDSGASGQGSTPVTPDPVTEDAPPPITHEADPVQPVAPPVDPQPEVIEEESIPGLRYEVQAGDTLYGILMRAYGKADEALIDSIAVASDLDDPSQLSVGVTLILPEVPGYQSPKRP